MAGRQAGRPQGARDTRSSGGIGRSNHSYVRRAADTAFVDSQLDLELVPTRRLGRVLQTARAERGLNLDRVAEQTNHHFSPQALSAIEAGRLRLEADELEMLSDIYGVRSGQLIPDRGELVIDLEGGTLAAGVHHRALSDGDTTDPEDVLIQYLSLVYAMRDIEPGRPVPLRDVDLVILAQALQDSPEQLETRLTALMSNPEDRVGERTRRLRRRLVVPAAGVLVGATAIGVLVLIQSGGDSPPTPVVEIGDAIVVERGSDAEIRSGMAPRAGAEPAAGVMGDVELIPPMVIKRGADGQIIEVTPSDVELIPPLVVEPPAGGGPADSFD
jgi:transcriptional regulator with XRE-family HTH domain